MKTILKVICFTIWSLCICNAAEDATKDFQITIAGSVKNPVHLKVNGTTRLSAMLAAAGGLDDQGSTRRISIIRCNEPMAYESAADKPPEQFTIRSIHLEQDKDPTVAELDMKPRDQLFFRRKFFIGK
jgi:protein involved in polysaccharide export with SLBB domain